MLGKILIAFVLTFIVAVLYFAYGSIAGGLAIIYLVGMYILTTIILAIACFVLTLIVSGVIGGNPQWNGLAWLISLLAGIIGEIIILGKVESWIFLRTGIYGTWLTVTIFISFVILNILIALLITHRINEAEMHY
ncbi:MAG: hypothetical protein WC788_09755 [Candidatus Paceibacterota bacterium]|jgi:hypothetical protein